MQEQASRYFPEGAFEEASADVDRFVSVQDWYGEHLRSMCEPSLFAMTESDLEVYRILCLPSFDAPFVIRIAKTANGSRLTLKETSGLGGYDAGHITRDDSRVVAAGDWRAFEHRVERTRFWSMATNEECCGLDGSDCVVEGRRAGTYHVVARWNPCEGPFYELCEGLLELVSRGMTHHL